MLVLTRKQNQEIFIGDDIKITVLKVKGNNVRLGIEAPRDINVVRGELPRHDKNVAPESESPQVAEFTVVFSNTDDAGAKVDVIPFQPNPETESSERRKGSSSRTQPDSMNSVQFRGKLPPQLQRNRLQEIVSKLTTKPESSNVEV